jgi:DNA repair exonuclease SbcCD nuclease subunit
MRPIADTQFVVAEDIDHMKSAAHSGAKNALFPPPSHPTFIFNEDRKVNQTSYQKHAIGCGLSILAIGDPHFRVDTMVEMQSYVAKIIQVVKKEAPDYVVILGDVLHTHERIHSGVANQAYSFINNLSKLAPTYVLVGNHDYINNSQFLSENHWMTAMKKWKNVYVVDTGTILETEYGNVIMCPYVFPGKFKDALNIIDSKWKDARVILCHQEMHGCKMGAIISEIGDKWNDSYPPIISGHIHERQVVNKNIFYTGSSLQHAFGESSDKTISLCHIDDVIRIENIDLEMPRKIIVYKDVKDLESFPIPCVSDGTRVRITASGTSEDFAKFKRTKKYKDMIKLGIKIVPKTQRAMLTAKTTMTDNFYEILRNVIDKEHNRDKLHAVLKELVNIAH